MLPVEQKGCRKRSRGTKDQLLIDKAILEDSEHKHRNLAMAWVDYKKAYDMVPHSWIIKSPKLAQVTQNVIAFLERSIMSWTTDLTSCGQTLGTVKVRRGIFQGDSLSQLLFCTVYDTVNKDLKKSQSRIHAG